MYIVYIHTWDDTLGFKDKRVQVLYTRSLGSPLNLCIHIVCIYAQNVYVPKHTYGYLNIIRYLA